jgi:hypothetical protein
METTEIRVRPVVRHVVTRYKQAEIGKGPDGLPRYSAGLETLGEFDSEEYAEQVAGAMRERFAARQYVAVERGFEVVANHIYFETAAAAEAFVEKALLEEREFRIYSRVVTDPVAKARIESGWGTESIPDVPPRVEYVPAPNT